MANSKAALPTIGDPITATQLANFAKSTASSLGDLRDAADKVCDIISERFQNHVKEISVSTHNSPVYLI